MTRLTRNEPHWSPQPRDRANIFEDLVNIKELFLDKDTFKVLD